MEIVTVIIQEFLKFIADQRDAHRSLELMNIHYCIKLFNLKQMSA